MTGLPPRIVFGVVLRTAYMWFGVRMVALLGAGVLVIDRIPAAVLLVGVVVVLRYIDGLRRREFLFLQNLAVSPVYPLSITTVAAAAFEAIAWASLV